MYLDIIFLFILLITVRAGYKKGGILEFFSLFGIFLSLFLTKYFVKTVYIFIIDFLHYSNYFIPKWDEDNYYFIFVYFITFSLIYLILYLNVLLFRRFLHTSFLKYIDNSIGALLGFIRGLVLIFFISALLNVISNFNYTVRNMVENSTILKILPKVDEILNIVLPKEIKRDILCMRS